MATTSLCAVATSAGSYPSAADMCAVYGPCAETTPTTVPRGVCLHAADSAACDAAMGRYAAAGLPASVMAASGHLATALCAPAQKDEACAALRSLRPAPIAQEALQLACDGGSGRRD